MVCLSFIALILRIYDVIQWTKQYSNHLKKFVWNKSENDAKCQFNENMHCVSINYI